MFDRRADPAAIRIIRARKLDLDSFFRHFVWPSSAIPRLAKLPLRRLSIRFFTFDLLPCFGIFVQRTRAAMSSPVNDPTRTALSEQLTCACGYGEERSQAIDTNTSAPERETRERKITQRVENAKRSATSVN